MSLAIKYRPTSFEEGFVGQEITAKILKRTIQEKKFKNIMLFAGASGCGKTTSARIIAKLINAGIGDPIELDCASNNGVDQIRAIVEAANERSLTGEYKIFILDECHMITTAGWNSFLKCIEECPKYTIFIFCTTDPQKIPVTVMNRMQRFNFGPIAPDLIRSKLLYICQQEGFVNYDKACDLLSRTCGGCMREAITSLERCADYSTDLSIENVKAVLGGLSYETMFKLTWAIQNKNTTEIISTVESLFNEGQDLKNFINTYLEFIIDLVKFKLFNNITLTSIPAYLASPENAAVQYTVQDENSLNYFNELADALFNIKSTIKYDNNYKTTVEILLLQFVNKK